MKSYRDGLHVPPRCSATGAFRVALMITKSVREPTVAWLRSQFGMSRPTAYRWVRAWKEANGVCTE